MYLLHFPTTANVPIYGFNAVLMRIGSPEHNRDGNCRCLSVIRFASKQQGFGPEPKRKEKMSTSKTSTERKRSKFQPIQPSTSTGLAPGLVGDRERKPTDTLSDRQFMNRLEVIKRSALEQKKAEEKTLIQSIDYDAPIESETKTIGLGTKVGAAVAVIVFGLVFALGDFLPSGSLKSNNEVEVVERKLTAEEKATLQRRLQQYEAALSSSPKDLEALEGAAVTFVELGEYKQASVLLEKLTKDVGEMGAAVTFVELGEYKQASGAAVTFVELGEYKQASVLLEKLTKERPEDYEAYRLLGEVKYQQNDYEGSTAAYRSSLSACPENFAALQGLTDSLLAAKKPDEAVQVILSFTQRLNEASDVNDLSDKQINKADPIQVQLLLAKAYANWGHVSDAVTVYDQLISKYPEDFRGYLAKGIILKENKKLGDAERMFIQARFFAPDKAKGLVDRYSRRSPSQSP